MNEANGSARRSLAAALVLALGLVLAAVIFGAFFYRARAPQQTVQVVGSATRSFVADVVKWRFTVSRPVSDAGLPAGYAQLRADVQHCRDLVRSRGLPDSALIVQPPTAQPLWGREGVRTGYTLQQPVFIISDRIADVEPLALDPAAVLRAGAALEFSQLEYFYSGIASLKHELLSTATRDARERAAQIADNTDSRVGKIISARSGVFQITEPYSTEVSGLGMHATATRQQEITVTVHASFALH
ncbi:MAG: DUF541 domain-containing protein [Gemmatimonadetes bacterium]|nr:DUF541 domain-containing protein [Gemmatimonadota bacterium]